MKIVSIVGARPQFIKLALLSRELRKNNTEFILHTGQHYDYFLSQEFFDELEIPKPDINIGVGSGSQASQTAKMIVGIEDYLLRIKPDLVLVYGDTNSTIAGALVAAKGQIPVGHVEAGYRSFNKRMPEEVNRILTDHVSDLLFCATRQTIKWLKDEGIKRGVHFTGDLMYDAALFYGEKASVNSEILKKLSLKPKSYILSTIHRSTNTDDPAKLRDIIVSLSESDTEIVIPLHPRTKKTIETFKLDKLLEVAKNVKVIKPVGYLDMLVLEKNAEKIITDSGGVQKEAYFFEIPCITVRDETESVETLEDGWNVLVGSEPERIKKAVRSFFPHKKQQKHFGNGDAHKKIAQIVNKFGL